MIHAVVSNNGMTVFPLNKKTPSGTSSVRNKKVTQTHGKRRVDNLAFIHNKSRLSTLTEDLTGFTSMRIYRIRFGRRVHIPNP